VPLRFAAMPRGFCGWALLGSNQWPLPCEGKSGVSTSALNARCGNGFPFSVMLYLAGFCTFGVVVVGGWWHVACQLCATCCLG